MYIMIVAERLSHREKLMMHILSKMKLTHMLLKIELVEFLKIKFQGMIFIGIRQQKTDYGLQINTTTYG